MDLLLRPIVGIVLTPEAIRDLNKQPPSADVNLHADAAKQVGITAYAFALRDVDPQRKMAKGWVKQDGRWARHSMPWPDVFYEQFCSAVAPENNKLLSRLYQSSIPINVARSLGKWLCHDVLHRSSSTKKLLPDTRLYAQPKDMITMLSKHPVVFTKPDRGSGGHGISRIISTGKSRYTWQDPETGRTKENLSIEQILHCVMTNAHHMPFVIQEEIPLYMWHGRRGDIRITMIKDGSGRWTHTRSGIRLAQPGQFITNRKTGADSLPFPEGLDQFVGHAGNEKLLERIFATALSVVQHLEKHLGPMGEIGVDLALDKNLRLWFLEANAKPSKSVHGYQAGDPPPAKFIWVMEYARYLWTHRKTKR